MKKQYQTSLKVVLFLYGLFLLGGVHYISIIHNGQEMLTRERSIICAVCLFLIEIVNQVSYWLGKIQKELATKIRLISLWLIITVGASIYYYFLSKLQLINSPVFLSRTELLIWFTIIILSLYLPFYSFCLNVRFICLFNNFSRKKYNGTNQ